MTIGTLKTQGTELWLIDTVSASAAAVLKFSCPTGISGLGGAGDQLDDTCLDNTSERTYKRGLGNPGQVTVPFNFIPRNASHQVLYTLKSQGLDVDWMIGFSDGTAAPTLDSNDAWVVPANRTVASFVGYVSDVNIDVATNEIVRGTLVVQRSGEVTWTFYEPA
jgi:Phage tail tube, TTP, lambda-like